MLGDETHWTNELFHPLQHTASNFLKIANTWYEQRDWGLTYALEALGNHPLANQIQVWMTLTP